MLYKRATILGLSIVIALALAACGRSQDQPTPTAEAPAAEATAAPEVAETEAETETEPVAETEAVTETDAVTTEAAAESSTETTTGAAPLITVESETFVGDIINDNDPALVTLSADGSRLVWPEVEGRLWNRQEGLCTYIFDSAATSCEDVPETFEGYPYAFFSSPDSTAFAFTEDPIQLGYESDIWTFDVESGAFNDLTNDNVEGSWLSATTGDYWLDYLPMWSPEGDSIYFWRSEPIQAPITFTLQLMRIAPAGGEPELVRDLSEDLAGELLYFSNEYWFMDGVSALSPDGSKVALILADVENPNSANTNGIWIVDVNDASAAPQQIADQAAMQSGQPSWSAENFPLVAVGLSWKADSSSIVVMTYNQDEQVPLVVLYDINVDSGEMTPIVDFSNVPDENTYMTVPVTVDGVEGPPMRAYSPWTASMSPNNELVLMYQNIGELAGLLVSELPPTTELPVTGYVSQLEETVGVVRSSRGTDGKVLIYNILFATTPTE
jgi:Tol biopolymer transport system component